MPSKPQTYEVQHLPMEKGRKALSEMDFSEYGIPSIAPLLDGRYKAEFKGKFLDPGENAQFLDEVLRVIKGLQDVTTQRAVYYTLRGAHPEWTYKGEPLGQEFYDHLINWIMEKAQLKTGMTMQSMGVYAGPRGYIAGDGVINTLRRGRVALTSSPSLDFDLAQNVTFATRAKKVIHFEKDAGLNQLISRDFPKYVEAIFSTSQGVSSEAAMKFLRVAEDAGFDLYSVNDGDPSGIQMALQFGMATKNNCYMPSEFYPKLVKPLGFYPSIGEALNLPPEDVTDKEDKIFNNIISLVNEKQRVFPQLKRFGLGKEVKVIIDDRKKWEFQALNAIHETAPKIFILETLRVHEDDVKYVPEGADLKERAINDARVAADSHVNAAIESLAQAVYDRTIKQKLISSLRTGLEQQIADYREQVDNAIATLEATDDLHYREYVKAQIVSDPSLYAEDLAKKLGRAFLTSQFSPTAAVKATVEVTNVSATYNATAHPPARRGYISKTQLVESIERQIIKDGRLRERIVSRIRGALEQRFGRPREEW